MGGLGFGMGARLALAAAASLAAPLAAFGSGIAAAIGSEAGPAQVVVTPRRKALAKNAPARYRGRFEQARPKKRPNRKHISRRTKAKHRRARKAA